MQRNAIRSGAEAPGSSKAAWKAGNLAITHCFAENLAPWSYEKSFILLDTSIIINSQYT